MFDQIAMYTGYVTIGMLGAIAFVGLICRGLCFIIERGDTLVSYTLWYGEWLKKKYGKKESE